MWGYLWEPEACLVWKRGEGSSRLVNFAFGCSKTQCSRIHALVSQLEGFHAASAVRSPLLDAQYRARSANPYFEALQTTRYGGKRRERRRCRGLARERAEDIPLGRE